MINELKLTRQEWWDLVCFCRREMNNAREAYTNYRLSMKGKSLSDRCAMLNEIKLRKKELRYQVNRMNLLFGEKYGRA